MASESELSVDQVNSKSVKQRKTLRNWFKTLPTRKKIKTAPKIDIGCGTNSVPENPLSLRPPCEESTPEPKPSSRNVLQRMKLHFVKKFSKSSSNSKMKIQVNELYESADPDRAELQNQIQNQSSQEPKTNGNFADFYKAYLEKKWLLNTEEPNELMYKASVEMLR